MSVVAFQKKQREGATLRCVLHNPTDHEVAAHIQRLYDIPVSPPWYAASEFDLLLQPGASFKVDMLAYDIAVAKQRGLIIEEVQT